MDAILDEEAEEIGIRFRDDRRANDLHLKARFEEIFRKYERDFTGVGDEIDLLTGNIIIDNGHLQSMQHEIDTGDNTTSFIDDLTLQAQPESGDATPDVEDESDFDDALDSLGREIDELSELSADHSGVASDPEEGASVEVSDHAVDHSTVNTSISNTAGRQSATDAQWLFPELPKDGTSEDSLPDAKTGTGSSRPRPKASPLRSRSIWAPDRRPGRPRTRTLDDAASQSEISDDEDAPVDVAKLPSDLLALHASMGRVPAFQQIYAANTARRLAPKKPLPDLGSAGSAQNHVFDALRPDMDSQDQHAVVRQSLEAMQSSHLTQLAYQRYMLQHQKAAARAPQHRKLYTKQEDELIIELHCRKGLPWVQIRDRYLPERNLESLLNRWTYLRRRVIGDLIENGEIGPETAGTKQNVEKVNGFKLSASYRADALRASLLAKADDNTSPLETGDEHDDPAERTSSGQFTAQDDAKIKKLRDEEKLLFSEIAKQLPQHDESTITDRYYSHILGRSSADLDKAAAKVKSNDHRQYLRQECRPVLPPQPVPALPQQETGKLLTILPALGSLPSVAPPAPIEPQGPASFVVNHKLLKRTRRRKKKVNGEYVFVDSKRVREAFAGTDGSNLPKWAVATNTRHHSPDESSLDDSLANSEHTGRDLPALQPETVHQAPLRRLPSSIPDTEEEQLLSSNPMVSDRQDATIEPTAQIRSSLPAASKHRVLKPAHVRHREARLSPAVLDRVLPTRDDRWPTSQQRDYHASSNLPKASEDAHNYDESPPKCSEPADRQRATTPPAYGQLWNDLDSSPVFEPTSYGTPARWKGHSAPYFIGEANGLIAQQHSSILAPASESSWANIAALPVQPPVHAQPSTRDEPAEHLPAKRKSLEGPGVLGTTMTSTGSPVRKRSRTDNYTTKFQESVASDDHDEVNGLVAVRPLSLPSIQHEQQPVRQPRASLHTRPSTTNEHCQRHSISMDDQEDAPADSDTDHAIPLSDHSHHSQSTPRSSPPESASRTLKKHKGRLSELKRALSDRRHSAPLARTPARKLSEATARRMSALAHDLSDDELA